jgi:hypothetical protein
LNTAVLRVARDRQVKRAVGAVGAVGIEIFGGDLVQQGLDFRQVLVRHLRGGECGRLAFKQQARLGHFKRGGIETGRVFAAGQAQHIGARADAHFHQPLHFKRDDRFAHGGAADVETRRQVAFGRQARAHRIVAPRQFLDQQPGQILVQPVVALLLLRHRGCFSPFVHR